MNKFINMSNLFIDRKYYKFTTGSCSGLVMYCLLEELNQLLDVSLISWA
jgi:hypothetical protein